MVSGTEVGVPLTEIQNWRKARVIAFGADAGGRGQHESAWTCGALRCLVTYLVVLNSCKDT